MKRSTLAERTERAPFPYYGTALPTDNVCSVRGKALWCLSQNFEKSAPLLGTKEFLN